MFIFNNGYYKKKKLCNKHRIKLNKETPVSIYTAFKKCSSFKFFLNNFYLSFRLTEVHVECFYKYTYSSKKDISMFVTKKPCFICLGILINCKTSFFHFLFFFLKKNNKENYFNFLFNYRQNIYNILKLFFLKKRKNMLCFK